MSRSWPLFPFGDILCRVERFESRNALTEYQFAGTYSFARGIFVGERKEGSTFALDKIQRIHAGDFVYCKIMAWEGAFGIVPPEAHDCVMSGAFVAYEINKAQIEPKYLKYYFKLERIWKSIGGQSTGTNVRRKSLHPDQFEKAEIPLPPLDEQRRIVAHIEALDARIAEARGLRQQAVEEAKSLLESYTDQVLMELASRFESQKFSEICTTITDGDHITPQFSTEGVKFIFVGNVSSGRLHFNNCKYVTEEYFAKIRPQRIPQRGDILYSAVGATLGVPALVDVDEPFCFQRHIAILKPDHSRLDSRFAWHMLQSGKVYQKAWSSTTGSAQPTIPLKAIRELEIPVPPIQEQQRIVTHLDDLHARIDALKRLQAETAAELDALLPAVLDRAFHLTP